MSTSTTTNLQLVKENADEPILRNHRQHTNDNLDTLDTAIKAVQDATATLEKARLNLVNLIGNIGKDANNADLISKAQARATLDVAQSNGAASTLYAAEQAIATNASAISSLRDSVGSISTNLNSLTINQSQAQQYLSFGANGTQGTYYLQFLTTGITVFDTSFNEIKHLGWLSIATPRQGVKYLKIGALVVMTINITISGATAIDAPTPTNNSPFLARENSTGNFATFWTTIRNGKLCIEVYKATGYTAGNEYCATFAYLTNG